MPHVRKRKMMRRIAFLAVLILAGPLQAGERPWLDGGQTTDIRVQALLDAMTVEEKMSQLFATSPDTATHLQILTNHHKSTCGARPISDFITRQSCQNFL